MKDKLAFAHVIVHQFMMKQNIVVDFDWLSDNATWLNRM